MPGIVQKRRCYNATTRRSGPNYFIKPHRMRHKPANFYVMPRFLRHKPTICTNTCKMCGIRRESRFYAAFFPDKTLQSMVFDTYDLQYKRVTLLCQA
jgi:hypothetical protein